MDDSGAAVYQVIPFKFLAVGAVWLALSVLIILSALTSLALPSSARYAAALADAILFVLTIKQVWRFFWRIVPFLNRYFPDLNGEYEVELRGNWPIQQKMLEAAAGGDKFDPRLVGTIKPELGTTRAKAIIDLSFYTIRIHMFADASSEAGAIIDNSLTLSTTLIRARDGHPHQVAYIYKQKNRRDRQSLTDDTEFYGAALLAVKDGRTLSGEYWTNRAWHSGLNTAGLIVLKKKRK